MRKEKNKETAEKNTRCLACGNPGVTITKHDYDTETHTGMIRYLCMGSSNTLDNTGWGCLPYYFGKVFYTTK